MRVAIDICRHGSSGRMGRSGSGDRSGPRAAQPTDTPLATAAAGILLALTALCGAGLRSQDAQGAGDGQQQGPVGPPSPAEYVPESQKVVWPRDRNRPVLTIRGAAHSVEDVLRYVNDRHAPRLLALVDTPGGRALFSSPQFTEMVRLYGDIQVLAAEAERRGLEDESIKKALSASLKRGFEKHLEDYVAQRKRAGRPIELTQDRINILLEHYQNANGLGTELQGWLDALVEETPLEADGILRDYYQNHPRYFGGRVTLSHILVRHRDPRTGELYVGEQATEALRRIADVRARLAEDGSNFEEIARRLSEDRITAQEGGLLREVARFDERLPASLCRAVWKLRDGEFTVVPVESKYGLHFIKRVAYNHSYYIYYHEKIKPEIAATKRQEEQEDLLWKAREDNELKRLY